MEERKVIAVGSTAKSVGISKKTPQMAESGRAAYVGNTAIGKMYTPIRATQKTYYRFG